MVSNSWSHLRPVSHSSEFPSKSKTSKGNKYHTDWKEVGNWTKDGNKLLYSSKCPSRTMSQQIPCLLYITQPLAFCYICLKHIWLNLGEKLNHLKLMAHSCHTRRFTDSDTEPELTVSVNSTTIVQLQPPHAVHRLQGHFHSGQHCFGCVCHKWLPWPNCFY